MKTFFTTCIFAFLHVTNNQNALEYFNTSKVWKYINDIINKTSFEVLLSKEILLNTATSSHAVFSRKNKITFFLKDATRFFKNYIDYSFRISQAMKFENNLSYALLYTQNTKTKDDILKFKKIGY